MIVPRPWLTCALAAALNLGASADGAWALTWADSLSGPYTAQPIRVVDGDTIEVQVRIWIGQDVRAFVRLDAVDTPELRGRCAEEKSRALAAKAYLEEAVAAGHLRLHNVREGRYPGRIVARVETSDGTDLSEALVRSGHGLPSTGRRLKEAWCPPDS